MGRRGGGGRAPTLRRPVSPAPRAPVQAAPPRHAPAPQQMSPAHPPPMAAAPMAPQPKQPGMMAQIATTAAGVAVGSTVGHVVGHAITGGGGGGGQQAAAAPVEGAPQPVQQAPMATYPQDSGEIKPGNVCWPQMKEFLDCAQNQHDFTLCQGYNEALKQCKADYGIPS